MWLIEECHWGLALWKDKCYDFPAQPVVFAGIMPLCFWRTRLFLPWVRGTALTRWCPTEALTPPPDRICSGCLRLAIAVSVVSPIRANSGRKTAMTSIQEEKHKKKGILIPDSRINSPIYTIMSELLVGDFIASLLKCLSQIQVGICSRSMPFETFPL